MEITSIRLKKLSGNDDENNALLGVASVQFDNCLIVHNIKLISIDGKRIVSFPNRKSKRYEIEDGEYKETFAYTDIVHPSNSEFRNYVETELYKIYDSTVDTEVDINE